MPELPSRRYKVGVSAAQRERLSAELSWADQNGLAAAFIAALKEVEFRRTVEPNDWGGSRERLPVLRIQMRCGTSRMVTVLYGVAEDRDVVFVREYRIDRGWKPPPS
ncbi:MAG TPA: hypothetical protein VGE74_21600 [Gemmata sp.]